MQGRRSIFDDTIELFRKLHISDHSRPNASWQSVQTGMITATAAASSPVACEVQRLEVPAVKSLLSRSLGESF